MEGYPHSCPNNDCRLTCCIHDDVIKWKHFPHYWPLVRGIHRSSVDSPHKGQWRGALMFSLICARTNGWANNRDAGDVRLHRTHYDVTVMLWRNMEYGARFGVSVGSLPILTFFFTTGTRFGISSFAINVDTIFNPNPTQYALYVKKIQKLNIWGALYKNEGKYLPLVFRLTLLTLLTLSACWCYSIVWYQAFNDWKIVSCQVLW